MRVNRAMWCVPIVVSTVLLLTLASAAVAHEDEEQGDLRLTIGWRDEPAYSGLQNLIDVVVSDRSGAPVSDPAGSMTVEVGFGAQRVELPLLPTATPGAFAASLIPTRSGTYSFHITGQVAGQKIDIDRTCSEETFDCVTDARQTQFPAKDPGSGELAQRLDREFPRAEAARSTASRSFTVSIVAVTIAVIALLVTVVPGLRRIRNRA